MTSASVILCHDGAEDPRFVYVNLAAAALWKMRVEQMIGMPSRLSAPPERRHERASALAEAGQRGVLVGYTGERIAADGTRFIIEDATLWSVELPSDGLPGEVPTGGGLGQAAVFDRWHEVPQRDSGGIVR